MHNNRSFFGIACRAAAFSFLVAGTASLMQAEQPSVQSGAPTSFFLASNALPDFTAPVTNSLVGSSSSSDSDEAINAERMNFDSPAPGALQPPPRRRYGRPNYSNAASKWTGVVGVGLTLPVGDTHFWETPSFGFQVGFGRKFTDNAAVLAQFDYDHFGLQGATLANQNYVYDYGCTSGQISAGTCGVSGLDGNNHVWSLTLNPTYTLPTEGSWGAYGVVGGGYYHKVTNFTEPTVEESCFYFCGYYQVNANIDHYTSNAGGVNAGFGLTYKFSRFANERFYAEARYVLIFNQARFGINAQNVATNTTYTGTNFYPANSHRTTYIPIKFGIRF